jgi:pyruvate dehydrogenase E1 component alpha subunit
MLDCYVTMKKIRLFELRAAEEFAGLRIPGFVHLYVGQEAVATGVCRALRPTDYIVSNHRGHGHLIAKGGDFRYMMAELFGKKTGYCKGKGGSMHIASLDLGMLGANGIVGGGPPIAVGAALAAQYQGTDRVSICFFGDGASNQGTTHEAMNLAACWSLPVVFVVENNRWGEFTHQSRHQTIEDIADRAAGYNFPGVIVDGNDVMAVYETATEAVLRAREGKGPSLVECKTYRIRGHFEGDPMKYRSQDEFREWQEKDPIQRFERKLEEMRLLEPERIKEVEATIRAELEAAVQFAADSPYPDPAELTQDVYTV